MPIFKIISHNFFTFFKQKNTNFNTRRPSYERVMGQGSLPPRLFSLIVVARQGHIGYQGLIGLNINLFKKIT